MNSPNDRCNDRAFGRWLPGRTSGHGGLDEIHQLLITATARSEPLVAQREYRDE
jgi:hypothetical protein